MFTFTSAKNSRQRPAPNREACSMKLFQPVHSRVLLRALAGVAVMVSLAGTAAAADDPAPLPASITVHPAAIDLRHQRQPHSLQVLGAIADGYTLDLRRRRSSPAPIRSRRPWTPTAGSGPSANGQTQVTVTVAGPDADRAGQGATSRRSSRRISFRHEVMPVLSRAGCNMGGLPRLFARQERLQAVAARGRSRSRITSAIAKDSPGRRLNLPGRRRRACSSPSRAATCRTKAACAFAAAACRTRSSSNWIRQGRAGRPGGQGPGRRRAPGSRQARAAARPEASPAAARRLQRRHDRATSPAWASSRPTTRSSPTSTTRAW